MMQNIKRLKYYDVKCRIEVQVILHYIIDENRAAEYIFVPGTTNFGDLSCPLKNNQSRFYFIGLQ